MMELRQGLEKIHANSCASPRSGAEHHSHNFINQAPQPRGDLEPDEMCADLASDGAVPL